MSWGASSWGTVAWGATGTLTGTTPPPPPGGSGIGLTIGGADHTSYLAVPAEPLEISDELNSRRSCNFVLLDADGSIDRSVVAVGAPVRITLDGSNLLFAGTIDSLEESEIGDITGHIVYQVECVDWNQLCDRHVVAHRFEVEGQTLRDVVKAIAQTYSGDSGETLEDDGVNVSNDYIQQGPMLEVVAFNYDSVADAYDDLADLTGYTWYIDYSKNLRFFDRATYLAPYQLDPAQWQAYKDLRVSRGREKYRNIQYLRAGTMLSNEREEEMAGDGKTRTFKTSMPVGEKPEIWTDVGAGYVQIDPDEVDIRRDEEEQTGIKWFYQIESDSISQSSDESVLASDDYVKIVYQGQYPIIMQGRNDTEINVRKGVEGGTGTYVHVEEDDDVDDNTLAREKVNSLLRKFSAIEEKVSFSTDVPGFNSGQILTVNVADLGVSGEYLIETVNFTYVGDVENEEPYFQYRISAVKGESQGGWIEFFKRLAKKGRPYSIRENESVHLLRLRVHGIEIGDAISTTAALEDWDEDDNAWAIIGQCSIGGRRQGDSSDQTGTLDGAAYGPLIGLPYSS